MSEDEVVLDASAVIAFLLRESGWEQAEPYLPGGLLSTVNFCEAVSKFAERGAVAQEVAQDILDLQVRIVPLDLAASLRAAELRPSTRSLGLSLGDCICVALGLLQNLPVLTAERAWASLTPPHQIKLIR